MDTTSVVRFEDNEGGFIKASPIEISAMVLDKTKNNLDLVDGVKGNNFSAAPVIARSYGYRNSP